MIKFFRNIRQQLLSENKTGKYFKYAIGEIVLVVIGILIALQINNWNEKNKKFKISDQTTQILKTELQEVISNLEKDVEFLKNYETASKMYIRGEFNLDSIKSNPILIYKFVFVSGSEIDLPILERELTSDGLIYGKEDLNLKLREINIWKSKFTEASKKSSEYWHNHVAPYFIKQKVMIYMHKDIREREKEKAFSAFEKIYNDGEFRNMASYSNSLNSALKYEAEHLIEILDKTLQLIEEK